MIDKDQIDFRLCAKQSKRGSLETSGYFQFSIVLSQNVLFHAMTLIS